MTTFGKEVVVLAPRAHGCADQLFAGDVALGGVDDVEAGVQRAIQQFLYRGYGDALITNLRPAKAENAGKHIGIP
jgi:hypothetical protein